MDTEIEIEIDYQEIDQKWIRNGNRLPKILVRLCVHWFTLTCYIVVLQKPTHCLQIMPCNDIIIGVYLLLKLHSCQPASDIVGDVKSIKCPPSDSHSISNIADVLRTDVTCKHVLHLCPM